MERLENVRNLTSGMKYSSKLEVNQVRKLQFEFRTSNYECENNRLEALSESHRINITCNKEVPTNFLQDNLLEKYFLLWKKYCTNKQVPVINNNERIHKFVDSLKMYKENASMKKQSTETNKNDRAKSKDINFNTFEHRFKAQREVIETQKIKLIEQARIIETLKLGLIEDELEKSLSNAKNEIREIFQKCSVKVRCRTHILNENVPTMQVKSNSVPRIFRRMEKRAEERLLKRQIIIQRKMMLEEIKKKHTEEVMEKKKAADEEQRLKNLHDVEDKRLKEIELEKLKKAKREIYLKKLHKAVLYYNKKLKHLGFISLRNMLYVKKKNEELSNIFYNSGMQRKCIRKWNLYVKSEMQEKYLRADAFYKLKCLKPAILSFKFVLLRKKQSLQVAQDFYEMRLSSKIFVAWYKYVHNIYEDNIQLIYVAKRHYLSRILFQYFFQWKSLPVIVKLEKDKEEKKQKWREKVREILPDYNPQINY